ncbi:MAG: glycosyltransferase family 39 protein [Candidatus Woesearchaeota archaeon]
MSEEKKDVDIEIFPFLKRNWKWILLLIILVFAFYLRIYHVDYPVVGYHNWKETHYLTEARNFADDGFFANGFFIPAWNYPIVGDDPSGAHADSFPMISVIVGFLYMIFGESLAIARVVNILFMLGAILMLYLFTKELTKREDMAFTVAALAAILPLFIFFGRQMQLVNPALFFMVGAGYFYLKWRKNINFKNSILVSVFLALTFLTKYDFFFIFLPILLTFPYKKVFKKTFIKENKKSVFWSFLILLTIPLWLIYTKIVSERLKGQLFADALDFGAMFKEGWWDMVWLFINDSITHLGFYFMICGLIIVLLFLRRRKTHVFLRAMIYSSPVWIIVASGYLKGHVYHQYPIAPLMLLLIAYLFVFVGVNIEKFVKIKYTRIIVILIFLIILYFPAMEAKDRMFNTQFVGLDIAGEYIKEHSAEDERLVFPSHQSYGILWHADRMGYGKGWSKDLDTFKKIEDEDNVRWVFVYQWGMDLFEKEELWEYISETYSLKQIAFMQNGEQVQPIYFLLEKGGSFDLNNINNIVQNKEMKTRDYEYSFGVQRISYINV